MRAVEKRDTAAEMTARNIATVEDRHREPFPVAAVSQWGAPNGPPVPGDAQPLPEALEAIVVPVRSSP